VDLVITRRAKKGNGSLKDVLTSTSFGESKGSTGVRLPGLHFFNS